MKCTVVHFISIVLFRWSHLERRIPIRGSLDDNN
jgi:hypothetical protein